MKGVKLECQPRVDQEPSLPGKGGGGLRFSGPEVEAIDEVPEVLFITHSQLELAA